MSDNHQSQTCAPVLLEVERFQHHASAAERVVLRVDGRYGDRPGKRVLDAMLFVDDGLAVHRHAPLADDEDPCEGWLWRAAFEVPASYLTDARTRFALESEPGRLIDLPRPAELVCSGAIPLTARAAHIARRYAAAVAVVLTVAVAPGVLPSQARTEILRVHHADGTVVYMTTDGQTLAALPADAVVIDQPAPTMEPAQQPAVPAPADDPEPSPERRLWDHQTTASDPHPAATKHDGKKHVRAHEDQGQVADAPSPGPDSQAKPAKPRRPHRGHRHPGHPAATPDEQPQLPAGVPTDAEPLTSLQGLVAGSKDAQLQPIDQIDTAPPADTAAPADPATPPSMEAVPHFFDASPPATPEPADHAEGPNAGGGKSQDHIGSHRHAEPPKHDPAPTPPSQPPLRHSDGSPTASNPTFFDALPGPAHVDGVPNFVIQKFHVPPFLLSIYQAAGIQYGIRWEVLAAINEIETDYGRNLNVSSAGALGWMQFMPATWKQYGTDANKDGERDPYNPVDAIFAAARYLKAAGGDKDIRRAIFAYNHAGWYVDSVMLRARLIAGYPPDLIGSLTGLTEGRFPVAAHARYADDLSERAALKRVKAGQNAANVVDSSATRRGIDIFAKRGAPVVAVNDGVIKKVGRSKSKGLYVVLQDVYGNRYTYSGLGSLSRLYPVPKADAKRHLKSDVHPVGANDPKPSAPASAGTQRPGTPAPKAKAKAKTEAGKRHVAAHGTPQPKQSRVAAVKQRLFAHPQRPVAREHGGLDQILSRGGSGFETYDNYFSHALGLNSKNARLKRLKKGSHVIASTVLGRVGPGERGGKASHVHFEIQPAGKGAPKIDPKPILDGWKLLESTAVYRAKGKNVLYGDGDFSIGQIMLLPKALLAKRVLSDPRIDIYPGGRRDIKTGQIDRRVLVVLEYLAESGLEPTVSCLKSGHSLMTASGNISEHSSGNAVDISAINGVPILGHQEAGGVTDQAVRRLMLLQGTIQPHQIISLLDYGRNTMALPDHANHIHVGFHPLFGENAKLGREAQSVLKPGQWDDLVQRLGQIQNPAVPTQPSRYAIPSRGSGGE